MSSSSLQSTDRFPEALSTLLNMVNKEFTHMECRNHFQFPLCTSTFRCQQVKEGTHDPLRHVGGIPVEHEVSTPQLEGRVASTGVQHGLVTLTGVY